MIPVIYLSLLKSVWISVFKNPSKLSFLWHRLFSAEITAPPGPALRHSQTFGGLSWSRSWPSQKQFYKYRSIYGSISKRQTPPMKRGCLASNWNLFVYRPLVHSTLLHATPDPIHTAHEKEGNKCFCLIFNSKPHTTIVSWILAVPRAGTPFWLNWPRDRATFISPSQLYLQERLNLLCC